MKLIPTNQGNKNSNLFGLLASRFLFNGSDQRPHVTPDDEVSGAQRESEENSKRAVEALRTELENYNRTYGSDVPKAEQKADAHYQTIDFDQKRLADTEQAIQAIKAIKERLAATWGTTLDKDPQFKLLSSLLEQVGVVKILPEFAAQTVESAHRTRLQRRHEMLTQAEERKKLWGKHQKTYDELSGIFDSLASSKAFEGSWQTAEGFSSEKQREARQLFLAIMAEKTNGFSSDFVLGKNFGNDVDANIRNFPFLYNEFLKIQGVSIREAVSPDAILVAQSEADQARRNIESKKTPSPAAIIASNPDAGIDPSTVVTEPPMPDSDGWQKRASALENMVQTYKEKAANTTDLPQKGAWEVAAQNMEMHAKYAKASVYLSRLKDRENTVKSEFTFNYLNNPLRRKMVMELAMRQFVKAMEMVDKGPKGNSDWRDALHPTVRRMLIASIYENGVATYKTDERGNVTYEENTNNQNVWTLATLFQSDYFNFKERGEKMDADHEALLKAVYLGGKLTIMLDRFKPTEEFLTAWIKVRKEEASYTDPMKRREFLEEQLKRFPPEMIARFSPDRFDVNALETRQADLQKNREKLEDFLKKTKAAVNDPYSQDSKDFIRLIRAGEYAGKLPATVKHLGELAMIDTESLDAYIDSMSSLQINFNTIELQDKNSLMFFEGMGMHIEGVERPYLEAIQKDPSLKAENWTNLLYGTKEEFDRLMGLFKLIIPNDTAGGKEDFLVGLQSLRNKYSGGGTRRDIPFGMQGQEGGEDAAILNVLHMLRVHLTGRAETAASSDRKQKEIEARLKGMHIGDKITPYVTGVWDMLTGPGQSLSNRAAGLVLMYGFYKSARMAMKGEGKAGKALRALFVAGAIEIATKNITGRGVLDRLGLDAIAGAMEGTYEAVLKQHGAEKMKREEVTDEQHAAALAELNDVPFDQLMAWYENTDPNGMPRPKGAPDHFPSQININMIARGQTWNPEDKKIKARRIVKLAVQNFFAYVGEKDNHRDDIQGQRALKERWVIMVPGNKDYKPDYKPKYSSYDHREWFQSGGVKKSDITWQMVMRNEIDISEVDLTKGRTLMGQLESTVKDAYADVSEFVRQYVANPAAGAAEEFLRSMGEGSQDAKKFFAEVYEKTSRYVYFTKEKAVLWYGEHQYEIRRTAENHWQLFVTGVKMPFKLVYAMDQFAIPWTLAQLDRIEEILRTDKEDTIKDDLQETDILENPLLENVPNVATNKHFARYGMYQGDFLRAFRASPDSRNRFYENPEDHVGYYVAEMTESEAGINRADPRYQGKDDAVHSRMVIMSRKKAEQKFKNMGMTQNEVEHYMYPIHTLSKTTDPKKMYTFWRMPLRQSAELHLKESGHWADFNDPNRYKDREAFRVEPSQTQWENLKRGLALDIGPGRVVVGAAAGYASQVPKFIFWNLEMGGGVIKSIGHLFYKDDAEGRKKKKELDDAINAVAHRPDGQKQFLDEWFTSAESPNKALSDFYKKPENAKLYDFSVQYSLARHQPVYLGIMQGRPGYEGTRYLDIPIPNKNESFVYSEMRRYYMLEWKGKKPDKVIEDALAEAERRAANPTPAPTPPPPPPPAP